MKCNFCDRDVNHFIFGPNHNWALYKVYKSNDKSEVVYFARCKDHLITYPSNIEKIIDSERLAYEVLES